MPGTTTHPDHTALVHLNALGPQPSLLLLLVAGGQPTVRGHHPPPRKLTVRGGQEVPHGASATGIAGFLGHLAVGHHVARAERVQHRSDRVR